MSITAAQLVALVKVSGADEAAAKLVSLGGTVEGVGGKLGKLATGAVLVAGAAFIGLGALSVKMAADFQQGLTLLTTSANESQKDLGQVGAGILKMSVDTATGADKLESAMFTVESAGYHLANGGLKVLQAAAEGAKIENADLDQVTQALAITMHDWQEPANQAIDVMNSFREAAALGNMRMDDFTGAMKNVGPVAALAKIPLTDVEAALSTMSLEGDKGASAGTHLAQSLLNMISPSTKAQAVLKEIGLTAQQVSDDMQKSLPDTLKEITDDIGKKFPKGSEAYNHALSDMFGGTRGLKAILELTGANLKDFTNDAADLAPIMKQNATNVDGWSQVQGNFNFKLQAAGEAINVLMIKAGTQLLPILSKMLDAVTPLIGSFSDWIDKDNVLTNAFQNTENAIQSSINFYQQWQLPISTTATLLATFFVPAVIASGVQATVSAAKITYSFIASLIASGTAGWAAAFKIMTYVGVLIATGAQAIATAAQVTAQFIASMIASGVQAVASAAKITLSFVASLIATGTQAYIAAYAVSGSLVPALGAVGIQALQAAGKLLVSLVPALTATGAASWAALGPLGLLAAAIIGLGAVLKYAIDSAQKMDTGVTFNVDDMSTKNIQTVDRMRLHLNASTDQMVHGVTQDTAKMAADAAANAHQMDMNVTIAAQSMAAHTLAALADVKDKGGQSFNDLLKQVDLDLSQMDSDAKWYWEQVREAIENNPIVGHVTYTTAGGDIGVQQSPTTAHNAEGTDNWRGGWSWVGEKGPELMNIPRGAQIIPHDRSVAAASGGAPINLHVDVILDGTRMTGQLMPRIVQSIRQATGVRF